MANKRFVITLAFIISLAALSGCTIGRYSPEQLEATVQQIAATGMALTLTALPTNTTLPTNTPTFTEQPSATPEPSLTFTPEFTATFTPRPTFQPSATLFGQSQPTDFADSKSDKEDKNAPLLLDNQSGQQVHLIIDSPVYGDYSFSGNMSLILPEATYHYRAWIGNKGPLSGNFSITNGDKHVLTFFENKIHFSTP
jgi:hypothetical protein